MATEVGRVGACVCCVGGMLSGGVTGGGCSFLGVMDPKHRIMTQ